jgi:hypothetical protein
MAEAPARRCEDGISSNHGAARGKFPDAFAVEDDLYSPWVSDTLLGYISEGVQSYV